MFLAGLTQILISTMLRYMVPSISLEDVTYTKVSRSENSDSLLPSSPEKASPNTHHNSNFLLLALAAFGILLQSILVNYVSHDATHYQGILNEPSLAPDHLQGF